MITILQETTKWDNENIPNGIYHVNGAGQLVAYQAPGSKLVEYRLPIKRFSKSYRKFKAIGTREEELPPGAKIVKGSGGEEYMVTETTCTCSGFRFRGKCKHVGG